MGRSPRLRDRELAATLILEEAVETCAAMGFRVEAAIDLRTDDNPTKMMSKGTGVRVATFLKEYTEPVFPDAIDGLCDLAYVTFGAAVRFGIDLDPFFAEVQKANMAKVGGMTRPDGKVLKPEGWQPPDIEGVLEHETRWAEDPAEANHERLLWEGPYGRT